MRNNNYWKSRAKQVEQAAHSYGRDTYASVEKTLRRAHLEIEKQIADWYKRFADNNGIVDMAEARKLLNSKELKELKWDIDDYIKHGQENELDERWMKELENASARYHISRLEALKLRTEQAIEVAFGNELDDIDSMARKVFTESFYHTCYDTMLGLSAGWEIGQVNQSVLNSVVSKPWAVDGKNFSDRIWEQKGKLINEVHQELTRTCVMGEAPNRAIANIAKRFNVSKNQAGRLIMTEQAYFHSAAQKEAFKELDVEQYEIVATLDSHTSDICQDMDGKVFDMKDYEAGVTAPPFHVYCRSVTAPYFDDDFDIVGERAARDENGETYYVPADTTYPEWKEAFVEGNQKGFEDMSDVGIEQEQSKRSINPSVAVNNDRLSVESLRERLKYLGESEQTTVEIQRNIRDIVEHRDNTHFEDLAFVDSVNSKSWINKKYDYYDEATRTSQCKPSAHMLKMLQEAPEYTFIGIHNHPSSSTPSFNDIKVAFDRRYKYGVVVAHNGGIYKYSINRKAWMHFSKNLKFNLDVQLAKLERAVYNEDEEGVADVIASLKFFGIEMEMIP
jgi:SPP1 gp7 family putative phage head morphogenesis protein